VNEEKAARYHRLRRQASIAGTAAGVVWLSVLSATRWGSTLPMPLFIAVIAIGWELLSFPFTFYRSFLLERKYGLSSESTRTWFVDHAKAVGLGLLLSELAGIVVLLAMREAGAAWWAVATVVFALAAVLISQLAPVLLMPLFYRFKPLTRDALRERLLTLSGRAQVPVLGVFEWGLGEKTTRANAALVGVGGTRRILVSDTLLKDYSEDEIEVILAHEIAHHVHQDMWTGLALETGVMAAALWGADMILRRSGYTVDASALPLLALAAGVISFLLSPLGNGWSRHNERRADRFALDLTQRPLAFISAMRRLGSQNLAEERPSPLVLWFFHTHPTIEQRIAAARDYSESST
jgi:STE24 endopeptidase